MALTEQSKKNNLREFATQKLPAIAQELTSGPWTDGASRFLDSVVILVEEGKPHERRTHAE